MLRQKSLSFNWHFLLVGLFFLIMQCDARAVNVSNTWTMPQEGLNVFYRFFRDRISWFEADAVCQFHHANLVTVDNSFQFDATRDLLRELDVNDIVWIGLMRPQSSDRFMWSNSRPLVADTGYWAESLPLMDAPLCAVIDPIRDYRWHALRCGGPETASFLCEMPVPSWADVCNIKDMPNLTLQYMADTASIELIRNCQEEGLLKTICRGKQDRDRALHELICPRERLEAQRINDITNSHFKSLQIINSIPSDNNENNDIELLPLEVNYGPHYPEELQTEKNTVQRLIEQFNVDELMQADEPSNMETVSSFYKIPGLIPKPVKKSAKKVLDYPKKDASKQKLQMEQSQREGKKRLSLEMDDMMMGDQPLQGEPEMTEQLLNEEVSNEIMEPLPHIKKTNIHKEDGLEKMEKEAIAMKKSMQKSKEMETKKLLMMSSSASTTTTTTESATTTTNAPTTTMTEILATTTTTAATLADTEEVTKHTDDHTHKQHPETPAELDNDGGNLMTTSTTASSATIGHPMHPQQPRSNVITEETQHLHTKESADNSHFIPPMLMVKSHYVPPANKHGYSEHEHHHHHHQDQQQHEQLHLETTTEVQAETTIMKHEQNQTSDMTMMKTMPVTTPKVLAIETTLKSLDTSENDKRITITRQEENQEPATTTIVITSENDSNIKPITEQLTTETEQRKNSKILNFEEIQTTMTTTDASTTVSTLAAVTGASDTSMTEDKTNAEDETTLRSSNSEEINKNNTGQQTTQFQEEKEQKAEKQQQEEETLHITQTNAETTQTAKLVATTEKSLKSTEKLYDLETTADDTKAQEIADTTTAPATIQTQQRGTTTEEKLATAIKNQQPKEVLQTAATTQKTDITETTTTVVQTAPQTQQQNPTTSTTVPQQSLQQIEKIHAANEEPAVQESQDKYKDKKQNKKETIVERTEVLVTSMATEKAQQREEETVAVIEQEEGEEEQEQEQEQDELPATIISKTSITTTTTVKPITTTAPHTEVKSTETSFSSTSSTSSTTTTTMPTTTSTTTTTTTTHKPPTTATTTTTTTTTTTPAQPTTPISTTTTAAVATPEANAESFTATPETSAQTQTSPPETSTHNFLKVSTEMPFKPNRRRSLTKPETVSYMKKILG